MAKQYGFPIRLYDGIFKRRIQAVPFVVIPRNENMIAVEHFHQLMHIRTLIAHPKVAQVKHRMPRLDALVVPPDNLTIHVLYRLKRAENEFSQDILVIKMLISCEPIHMPVLIFCQK